MNHKHSIDPKLLKLKNCLQNNQKERAPKELSPVVTKQFGLLFAGEKIVTGEELRKKVVDPLHFGHPGPSKMLAEGNIFSRAGMRKNMEEKAVHAQSAQFRSKFEISITDDQKLSLLVLTEAGREVKIIFSGKLSLKSVTRELSVHIRIIDILKGTWY